MSMITVTCENVRDLPAYKNAGADELLVAYKENAFTALDSFDLPQLQEIKGSCDSFGLKMGVLMNRLYPEEETDSLKTKLQQLMDLDVSSIWYADPAIAQYGEELHCMDKLVYMPGMSLTSIQDAKFWMLFGLQSLVVSPFITKEELEEIGSSVENVTVQIHGRYAQSISHRTLVSAFESDLIGDKTLSLQEESRDYNMPIYENDLGTIIYTDYIQESFQEIKQFEKTGIQRFFINTVFANRLSNFAAIRAYKEILNGEDATKIEEEYRKEFSDLSLSDGYYGQATIK